MRKKGQFFLIDNVAQSWLHQIPATRIVVAQFLHSHNLGTCGLPFPPISPNGRNYAQSRISDLILA